MKKHSAMHISLMRRLSDMSERAIKKEDIEKLDDILAKPMAMVNGMKSRQRDGF